MNYFARFHIMERSSTLNYSILFLLVTIMFISSCKEAQKPYPVVEFTGIDDVYNYSRSLDRLLHKSDSVNPVPVLAGKGDLIIYNDKFFYFMNSSQNKIQFQVKNDDGYVNGKINCLNINSRSDLIPWFKQMKTMDLSSLDCIQIDSIIPESYYPYLSELAQLRPGIGLFYEDELKDISRLIKIFNPRIIIGGSISGKNYNLLSGLTNLELLLVTLNDTILDIPLPEMPRLNQLILSNSKNKLPTSAALLSANKRLERLAIVGDTILDLSILKPLENLRELNVSEIDYLDNIDVLKNQKHLELLSVTGKKFKYDQLLNGLPGLRWMTFSSNATQEEFDSFIKNHPDLEVAEIIKNDTIKSLQHLSELKNLYGLTITDTVTDMGSIKSLKNLKYLSLPDNILERAGNRDDLQKSLPGTKIDANEGFCLGSGWILLIIPFILAMIVFSRKKVQRAEKLE